MKLKLLDLFSGIGGFSLGLESTGFFETIGFVEKDKFCQKVLKKHWSNINIEEDIRNVKGEKYQADVVTGGFPCQPFSVAGKRKSTADDRYLWDEMLRVIREVKPSWIIAYSNNNGSYRSQGNATKQSSNEQKNRLSFGDDKDVPNTESSRCGRWSCKKCSVGEWSFLPREQEWCKVGSEVEGCSGNVSNSNDKRLQRFNSKSSIQKQKLGFTSNKNDEGRKTWWQTQSTICGTVNGLSYELDKDRSNRIKALGNSIVPQIARQIGLSIMEAELNG